MYLDIVIIDYLDIDGVLYSYKITPNTNRERVRIDRLTDIFPDFHRRREMDIGGIRIYNSESCSIELDETKLRSVSTTKDSITFQFEHKRIPIGPSREAHGGYYNLILPPNFRLTEIHLVDPYDSKHERIEDKKHFQYNVYWDKSCNTNLVTMMLRSRRGSFSFIAKGSAQIFDTEKGKFVDSIETEYGIQRISNFHILDDKAKGILTEKIAEKADWLELKPNIFGVGINLNKVIKDAIKAFKGKIKKG